MLFPFFDPLFDAFEAAGEELYYVGGFVRDSIKFHGDDFSCGTTKLAQYDAIMERILSGECDVDFATSARPEKTIEILKSGGLDPNPIVVEFGTIQVFIESVKVDITTFRSPQS